MAKLRPARRKQKSLASPAGGIPCLIVLASAFLLLMFFLYYVMKYSAVS